MKDIKSLLKELRTAEKTAQVKERKSPSAENALFLGTWEDEPYHPYLKGMFGSYTTFIRSEPFETLTHFDLYCSSKRITKVVSTSTVLLKKLLEKENNQKNTVSLESYRGSFFTYNGIEIVFISPLQQLFSVSYGKFLARKFISKLVSPQDWYESTEFDFVVLTPENLGEIYEKSKFCVFMSVDIETLKTNLLIRCIGFTFVFINSDNKFTSLSCVLPLTDEFALTYARNFLNLSNPKVFQNGKYDVTYLLRYDIIPINWVGDTLIAMHSWYSELPKDLAFLNAFFLRKSKYWKDLAETSDLYEYYKYNALDTWSTANVWIVWILTAPDWAKKNYTLEFPLVFPCLLAELTGIERDEVKLAEVRKAIDLKEAKMLASLRAMVGNEDFNPGSPKQVRALLNILGCRDLEGTGVKELFKARLRHPILERVFGLISRKSDENDDSIRGLRKLKSNYLRTNEDADKGKDNGAKEFCGRILYAFNPAGTDTGRLACKEHHFWTGLSIQYIPRGFEVKQTIKASGEFFLAECDLKQAESWDTAYITGDNNLIAAVNSDRDFHASNASAFFGVPYENIFDDRTRKTLNKKLRDLAKRVNHGANYNMGILVLIDTMGIDKILDARIILKLPRNWKLEEIAEYLLTVFHLKYSTIRGPIHIRSENVRRYLNLPVSSNKLCAEGTYYSSISKQISISNKLISRAYHHTESNSRIYPDVEQYILDGDWTRFCFGDPSRNKHDLNAYAAHGPQSLNSRTLNEGWIRVFYEVALPNPTTFRLHAQIHDSVLFSYAPNALHLPEKVKKCMEIPVSIKDINGVLRTFTVPADLKIGRSKESRAKYWSETE